VIHRRLGHEEHAEDVGLESALQLLLGDVANVLVGMLLASIVDEDVEPAQLIDGLLDGVIAKLSVANVAGNGDRLAALFLDDLPGLLRIVVLAQIEDRDVRTLASE
jgi:hypothetical protein